MIQRELDARVASIQYTETADLNWPAIEVAGDAFEAGVEWADGHPRWISVEDELPNFFDNVLYCDEDGDYYTETDIIGQDVKITHWMRIPDCPPLQDFCNKLRACLDGENKEGGEQ